MKILYATDGTETALNAGKFIHNLPVTEDSVIHILTVVPGYGISKDGGGYYIMEAMRAELDKAAEAATQNILDLSRKALEPTPAKIETCVRTGNPAEEIVNLAIDLDVDIVLMGGDLITASESLLSGNISLKVARYSEKSVLIVRSGNHKAEKILLAVDGSKYSHDGVRWLFDFPFAAGTHLVLLNVVHHAGAIFKSLIPFAKNHFEKIISTLHGTEKQESERILAEAEEILKPHVKDIEKITRIGEPAEEIIEAARENGADLIILGLKGESAISGFLLGGVARKVARYASCAVMIVKRILED